jgi:hypothetical protein
MGTMRVARTELRQAAERAGWRSHTFADGVRSLTLLDPLDAALAGRLWTRVSQLLDRGCRRLVVDASAIEPTGEQCALLAAIFAGRPHSYRAVVVAPSAPQLADLLPATVGVAGSLSEAHAQLRSGTTRRPPRPPAPPAPAARLPVAERRALSTRQSLRWAERAAREGDYERALSWLSLVERTDGRLDPHWRTARALWTAAWTEQTRDPQRARRR